MKKILGGFVVSALLAGPVAAADMPVKAPPPVIVTVFDWTGCYIGGHVGYAWGRKRIEAVPPVPLQAPLHHDVDGAVAGGQVGCNLWQRDRWVLGIEAQVSWANIDGDVPRNNQTFGIVDFHTKADVIGSIAGRFGYAFGATGQTLVFVKGGAAFIHERFSANIFPGPVLQTSEKDLRWGWMVGGGLEHALSRNWSLKGEYNYSHFGTRTVALCGGGVCDDFSIRQHVHLVKFGINYRFGGPVVARY